MSMHRTSIEYCRNCVYATINGSKVKVCNYLIDTGNLRNCEIGWCDKMKPRKTGGN